MKQYTTTHRSKYSTGLVQSVISCFEQMPL